MLDMQRIEAVVDTVCRKVMAQDKGQWITVHPGGKGPKSDGSGENRHGTPVLIDDKTGKVLGGMGGKFTGEKISEIRKDFSGPKTPKDYKKPKATRKSTGKQTSSSSKMSSKTDSMQKALEQATKKWEKTRKSIEDAGAQLNPEEWKARQEREIQDAFTSKGCTVKIEEPTKDYKIIHPEGYTGLIRNCANFAEWKDMSLVKYHIKRTKDFMSEEKPGSFSYSVHEMQLRQLEDLAGKLQKFETVKRARQKAFEEMIAAKKEIEYSSNSQRRSTVSFSGLSGASGISKITPARVRQYESYIRENAPEHVQQYIADRIGQIKIHDAEYAKTACFNPALGIKFNASTAGNAAAFLHEAGHAVDFNPATRSYRSLEWRNGQFSTSLYTDVQNAVDQRREDFELLTTRDYAKKYKLNGAQLTRAVERIFNEHKGSEEELKDKVLRHYIREEIMSLKADKETRTNIGDMILMSTKGKFGFGHDSEYADRGGLKSESQATEGFAEMTHQYCQFPQEFDILRQWFPNATRDYDQMIREM